MSPVIKQSTIGLKTTQRFGNLRVATSRVTIFNVSPAKLSSLLVHSQKTSRENLPRIASARIVPEQHRIQDTISCKRQQNYDGSEFCVTLVHIWVGLEALFWANNAMVWKSRTMTLVLVLTSRLLVSNGACKRAVENENSYG
jgi:hypothetical protein